MTWQDIAATIGWAGALALIPMAVLFCTSGFVSIYYTPSRRARALATLGWIIAALIITAWFAALLITGFNGGLA